MDDKPESLTEAESRPTRRQMIVGGATAAGIVTVSLPSVASAVSEGVPATTTTTTEAPAGYSESGAADPNLAAMNAVPVVTANGEVEVSGNDTF